jgi:hypothetical protein
MRNDNKVRSGQAVEKLILPRQAGRLPYRNAVISVICSRTLEQAAEKP